MLEEHQKKSYNFLSSEDQNREVLEANNSFLTDAKQFLTKREGYSAEELDSSEKIYDAYMEHFRYQDVNEVTAIRDLEYAQNANAEEKEQFARLISLYEKKQDEGFFDAAGDYVQGVFSAPSTYLGIMTGGGGKLAAAGATQVAKLGLKRLLAKSIATSAAKGATVEGAIGTGQALAQEMTKKETGYTDEISAGRIALTGGVSALTGGTLSSITGGIQTAQALKAAKKLDVAQIEAKKLSKKANAKAKLTIKKKGESNKIKFIQGKLKELDPEKVELGKTLAKEIADSKQLGTMTAKLPTELYENIAAATLDIASKMNKSKKGSFSFKKGDRITANIQRGIQDGHLKTDDMLAILKEYNIKPDQFSLLYKAELSEAGRTLGVQGNLVQALKDLENRGLSTIGEQESKDLMRRTSKTKANKVITTLQDLDRLRLGLMTSQPATTMRNNLNAGFRVAVDTTVRTIDNILNLRNPFDGNFDMAKYMLNPYEAKVTRLLLEQNMPDTARKLFRDAADLEATTGTESAIAKIGVGVNKLNTLSDNFFKQAMLTTSLRRNLKDAGKGELSEIIAKGEFNSISDDIMNKSIKESLEFVYQSSFEGADKGFFAKKTRAFLKLHRDAPFIISSFIPFPRFIANQMKFLYDHAPVIGYLGLENIGTKQGYVKGTLKTLGSTIKLERGTEGRKKLAQQLGGTMMLWSALAWRQKQGDTSYWYEIKEKDGNVIDGRAMYGPFAPFMLGADILYRYYNNGKFNALNPSTWESTSSLSEIAPNDSTYWRDATQALSGSTFRVGYGSYAVDKLFQDIVGPGDMSTKGTKIAAEFIGNVVNTYTMPVSAIKDLYSAYDEDSRYVPETRTGEVDFLQIVFNRGFRAFPDVGPIYDMPLSDPLRTGSVQAIRPIEKQLFGFNRRPAKNSLQSEMARLNLNYNDVYNRDNNELIDLFTRNELSKIGSEINLNEYVTKSMKTDEYALLKTKSEKRNYIIDRAREATMIAKDAAKLKIKDGAAKAKLPYSEVELQNWNKTTASLKKEVEAEYVRALKNGDITFVDGKPFEIKNVISDRDRLVEYDGKVYPVLIWGLIQAGARE